MTPTGTGRYHMSDLQVYWGVQRRSILLTQIDAVRLFPSKVLHQRQLQPFQKVQDILQCWRKSSSFLAAASLVKHACNIWILLCKLTQRCTVGLCH